LTFISVRKHKKTPPQTDFIDLRGEIKVEGPSWCGWDYCRFADCVYLASITLARGIVVGIMN